MQEEGTEWEGEGWKEKFCFDSLSPCLSVCLSGFALRSSHGSLALDRTRAIVIVRKLGISAELAARILLRRSGKETRKDFRVSSMLGPVSIALKHEIFLGFLGMLGPVHIAL